MRRPPSNVTATLLPIHEGHFDPAAIANARTPILPRLASRRVEVLSRCTRAAGRESPRRARTGVDVQRDEPDFLNFNEGAPILKSHPTDFPHDQIADRHSAFGGPCCGYSFNDEVPLKVPGPLSGANLLHPTDPPVRGAPQREGFKRRQLWWPRRMSPRGRTMISITTTLCN